MSTVVAILFLIVGLIYVIFPRAVWSLSTARKFRDTEPPESYFNLARVGGTLATIVGLLGFLVDVFHWR